MMHGQRNIEFGNPSRKLAGGI